MESSEKTDESKSIPKIEERQAIIARKIRNWMYNKYNLSLVGIIIFSIIIRWYFFLITKSQTLWWDEAGYMGMAKHYAFGIPIEIESIRPPAFMYLSAFFYKFGLGEIFMKIIVVTIPSLALIVASYYFGRELYNEKVGLIVAFFMGTSWTLLFWSMRFQPDYFSMLFQVLAVFFMWRFWKTSKNKDAILAGCFAALGFHFKVSGLLIPIIFAVFIALKDRVRGFTIKGYYYFAGSFILTLLPYMIWGLSYFGDYFPALAYGNRVTDSAVPFAWNTLGFFKFMVDNVLYVLFVLSFIFGLRFLLYIDLIIKNKEKFVNPSLFSILALAIISAYYIFFTKAIDDRWVFLWLPFMFVLIGDFLVTVQEHIEKFTKYLGVIIIVVLIAWGGYQQLVHANGLILLKKDSYSQVKDSSIWIKERSNPGDVIATLSSTQTGYYSERKIVNYAYYKNVSSFEKLLEENNARFFVFSIFEPPASLPMLAWLRDYLQTNQTLLVPIKAYYADAEQKQTVLIVYQVNLPIDGTPKGGLLSALTNA